MNKFPPDRNQNDELSRQGYTTITRHFTAVVARAPENPAFRLKTADGYISISYGEADRRVRGIARGLLALGLRRGDRVAILAENRPEWAIAYLGSYFAGTIAVPLDTQISPDEWRLLLNASATAAIFVSGRLLPQLRTALAGTTIPAARVIVFDAINDDSQDHVNFTDLIARGSAAAAPELVEGDPADVVTIIYTSGTTGHPKGVPLTHANVMHELRGLFGVIHVTPADSLLCLLPLQHVLASIINLFVPLYKGGYVVFADTLKRAEIMQALSESNITILATVPQFFYLFHNRIQDELARQSALARRLFRLLLRINRYTQRGLKLNLGRLFFARVHRSFGNSLRLFVSGGSGIDVQVARDFADMGFTILQGYGLTETTGACAVNGVERNTIGSVGQAIPGVAIKIQEPDENGIGEILVQGPIIMPGYYQDDAATRQAVHDGWFHSGDLGRLDAQGNLFITGRKKEIIVLANGKNIYPDELEPYYQQSPCIREIAIVGVRESGAAAGRGEKLHAVVVPDFAYLQARKIANVREALHDAINTLSSQLPMYKRLLSYQIQAEPLPRTTTQKLRRLDIKRMAENGEARAAEADTPIAPLSVEDRTLLDSVVGQQVVTCLRENYHRDMALVPDANLELDLGFDSMQRVELFSNLEEQLRVRLPDAANAEILTLRDLIVRLQKEAGAGASLDTSARPGWKNILSGADAEAFRPVGPLVSAWKYLLLKTLYWGICKPFLRLDTRGLEQIPASGPCLICPNHQSYIDPFVLIAALPFGVFRRMFFVGYSAFFSNPVMKFAARVAGIIPVDPNAHLIGALKACAAGLRGGGILCIFPEGGRSFDGELMEFKKGAAILAREMAMPIVPAAIAGAYEVWPRGGSRIRPGRVRVVFGQAFRLEETTVDDPYQADTELLRQKVGRLFDDLRHGMPMRK